MKITLLNGNPEPSGFEAYLDQLQTLLESAAHTVTRLDLRGMDLRKSPSISETLDWAKALVALNARSRSPTARCTAAT